MNKTVQSEARSRVTHGEISALAYRLWQAAGRPEGNDLGFWLRAEQQLEVLSRIHPGAPEQPQLTGGRTRSRQRQLVA